MENHPFYADKSTGYVWGVFSIMCVFTLIAGWLLEETGNGLATAMHMGSGLFAATIIALVTSLPEVSTGLESVWLGDYQLSISDIMGGNAFMLVIFLLADVVAAKPVLSFAQHTEVLWGYLGVAMMGVYALAFVVRPKRCFLGLGLDSLVVLIFYAVGVVGLSKLGG
jgi:cation:H+ antiporter